MTSIIMPLSVLGGILLVIYLSTLARTWKWEQGVKNPSLKGLAIPEGSIRGLPAFLVVGSFVVFIFFGADALSTTEEELDQNGKPVMITKTPNISLYTAALSAFGTLAGAVTGFYFGGRSTQTAIGTGTGTDTTGAGTTGTAP